MKSAKPISRMQRLVRRCGIVSVLLLLAGEAVAVELLVSDRFNSRVMRYDALTGAPIDTGEGAGVGVFIGSTVPNGHGGLSSPYDMLLGSDGNIYVASQANHSVKVYDGTTGHYIKDFVTSASGGLNLPWGMTWGPDGNLYVASSGNHRVLRYQGPNGSSPGAFMDIFVAAGSGGLNTPHGIMFGNDQWTGPSKPPGSAQDGYPELYVASYGGSPTAILRYNGMTGAFVDVYGAKNNQSPHSMIYERTYRRNNPVYNQLSNGNLLVEYESGLLNIWSGSLAQGDAGYTTDFNGFFSGPASRGTMAWGPLRPNATNGDKQNSLYMADYFGGKVINVGSNEASLGTLLTLGGTAPKPISVLLKCGRNPPTLIRKVVENFCLQGTVSTIRLQGDNLSALTAVSLKKMRNQGSGFTNDGTAVIPGSNLRMDGADLLVDFDVTTVEGGRYSVEPVDSCGNAMWFPDAVLVYMPELANGGFEEGWTPDREDRKICEDPGNNGNKTRPKHWDAMKGGDFEVGSENQFSFHRDGNLWHPCTAADQTVHGLTGLHYASIQDNFSNNDWAGLYQSIAAPHVVGQTSTMSYSVYIDAHVASCEGTSPGLIRLVDGDNYGGRTIVETTIPNTQLIDPDALVRSPDFGATVPAGYVYQSVPPILTIEFVHQSLVGDRCQDHALKAFHFDNARNYYDCSRSPWADADGDMDVDQQDFGAFQLCYTGATGLVELGCGCFDHDHDGLIDDNDFVRFQNCFTGPTIVSEPTVDCR